MRRRKLVFLTSMLGVLIAVSGCGGEDKLVQDGDPPEVTCERFHGVVDQFRDLDPEAVGFGELLTQVSEGFAEMETIADDAQDEQLGRSIDTLAQTLNSSIAAAGGDIDAIGAAFQQQLEDPEVHEAATYLNETCGIDIEF